MCYTIPMNTSMFDDGPVVQSARIIYTASAFAKANTIHLQEIGELKAIKPHASYQENLDSYLFFLVLEGSGKVHFEKKDFFLTKGDCAFLDCRQPYFHQTDADDLWRLKWAHFYGSNMNGIYDKYLQRGGLPCFTSQRPWEYQSLLDKLHAIAASDLYIRDMKIYEKLTALLCLLMEESWNPSARSPRTRANSRCEIQSVKDYIDQHYTEKISLDGLAQIFYINKFHLTRVFKMNYGISINSYIQQLRITQAKRLLRFSDLPVQAVALECGIDDANYFSRMFKKIEDVSPGEFRRMWKKE